ncbi:hypothetical protein CYMTET_47616 [Cymbomonas tetramitiformis]|uniref:Chromo domain-containing protein n=1 Tax=Cymbomonas tetramitiformis TaxID=36881 RepID=A0AAE0BVV4_9CHLO|nr:hypothetical protein CYMTET_47616 [Cymbomonas tetramitiformis]
MRDSDIDASLRLTDAVRNTPTVKTPTFAYPAPTSNEDADVATRKYLQEQSKLVDEIYKQRLHRSWAKGIREDQGTNHPYDRAGSDDVEYQVREIKAHRKCYGVDQYLVVWEGLATQHDTWEPVENLPGSEDDITAFCKEQAEKAAESEARDAANKRKRLSTARSAPNADGDEQEREDALEVEEDGQLLDPKNGKTKRRAKVWGYYWITKTDGRVTHTVCKLCGPNSTPAAYCGNTSNMRSHLSHVHQDAFCQLVLAEKKAEGVSVESSNSGHDTPDTGTIEAMFPQVSTEKRDVLHKKFALWIVRRRRSLSIGETDSELRDIFDYIFQGGYTLPTYKLVVQKVYKDHKLLDVQWDIVNESVYILNLTTECINLLHGTDSPTANLVLPLIIDSLAFKLHALTPLKYEKQVRDIYNEADKIAREQLYQAVCRRYFNGLMECKLEDFCVATCLDPRYKRDFEFKYLNGGEGPRVGP